MHSHKFFSNKSCMFFPCHTEPDDDFNCLFCYCPLYFLGDECGGNFRWVIHKDIKLKICSDCPTPHIHENYEYITSKLTEETVSRIFARSSR